MRFGTKLELEHHQKSGGDDEARLIRELIYLLGLLLSLQLLHGLIKNI